MQGRILAQLPTLPPTPKELMSHIRKCLISAVDEEILRTPKHGVFRLLKIDAVEGRDGNIVAALSGGEALDKGQQSDEFFYRHDGARISFAITVRSAGATLELVSYRFHLQFPVGRVPTHVRFDLNPEGSVSDDPLLEPRCHVHAGAEDLRVPTPLMGPIEILEKLLYGMPLPPRVVPERRARQH